MFNADTKNLVPSGHRAYFIPTNSSQVVLTSAVKSLYIRFKENLGPEHFACGGLLLLQRENGGYEWTFSESLFKQDHHVRLYACSLSHKEADFIAKDRALFIHDDDSRLSNFSLLSKVEKPSSCDEAVETFDLVNRHFASKRTIIFYHTDEIGNKIVNEIKTADYSRAKRDIALQPENIRNMQRFCNREGLNGEGPSDLQSRICLGYVKPINYPSKLISFSSSPQHTPGSSDNSDILSVKTSSDTDKSRLPPIRRYRKHSTAYYLMKIAFYSRERLDAEQHRHDLTYARKEKKPERVIAVLERPRRNRWTTKVLKKACMFCVRNKRRVSSSDEISGPNIVDIDTWLQAEEKEKDEDSNGLEGKKEIRRRQKLQNFSYEVSTGLNSVPSPASDEGISPLTLPPAAMSFDPDSDSRRPDCDSSGPTVDISLGFDSNSVEIVLPPELGSSNGIGDEEKMLILSSVTISET